MFVVQCNAFFIDTLRSFSPGLGVSASAGGLPTMPGKPPIAGGSVKTPSMSDGVDAPSMSGGLQASSMSGGANVDAPSMSGGADAPSMSGGVETPSMTAGVETPSMSGGLDLPSASSASVSHDKPGMGAGSAIAATNIAIAGATPIVTLPQSKQGRGDAAGGEGALVAAKPSPSLGRTMSGSSPGSASKLSGKSLAASAYVASITPKADRGTMPETRPKRSSSSGGMVSRLTAAYETKGPSPVVRRDGAGSFGGGSSSGLAVEAVGDVPKVEVWTHFFPFLWERKRERECLSAPQCVSTPPSLPEKGECMLPSIERGLYAPFQRKWNVSSLPEKVERMLPSRERRKQTNV